jgi:hypothetical protein
VGRREGKESSKEEERREEWKRKKGEALLSC